MRSRSIGKEIGKLSRAAHIYLQHQFTGYAIGHAQVLTLHFICRHNGLSQNELVQYSNLDKSSITSQLNKLERNGYITRSANKNDSREKLISITEKTKAIEKDIRNKFSSWSSILLDGFNRQEEEILFTLLDRMNSNAHEAINVLKADEEKS